MLCPFCKHPIFGVFFDLHDGELSGIAVVLQPPALLHPQKKLFLPVPMMNKVSRTSRW